MTRLLTGLTLGVAGLALTLAACAGETARDGPDATQTQCYLRIRNRTGEKLTVYVLYRAAAGGKERWLPAAPEDAGLALTFPLDPDQETFLVDRGAAVTA